MFSQRFGKSFRKKKRWTHAEFGERTFWAGLIPRSERRHKSPTHAPRAAPKTRHRLRRGSTCHRARALCPVVSSEWKRLLLHAWLVATRVSGLQCVHLAPGAVRVACHCLCESAPAAASQSFVLITFTLGVADTRFSLISMYPPDGSGASVY